MNARETLQLLVETNLVWGNWGQGNTTFDWAVNRTGGGSSWMAFIFIPREGYIWSLIEVQCIVSPFHS